MRLQEHYEIDEQRSRRQADDCSAWRRKLTVVGTLFLIASGWLVQKDEFVSAVSALASAVLGVFFHAAAQTLAYEVGWFTKHADHLRAEGWRVRQANERKARRRW